MIASYRWIGIIVFILGIAIVFFREPLSKKIYPLKMKDVPIPGVRKIQIPDKQVQQKTLDMIKYLLMAGLILATIGFLLFFLGEFNIRIF